MEGTLEQMPRVSRLQVLRSAIAKLSFDSYAMAFKEWDSESDKNQVGRWDLPGLQGYSFGYCKERSGFFVFNNNQETPWLPICPIQPCAGYTAGTRRCSKHYNFHFKIDVNYRPSPPRCITFPRGKGQLLKNGVYDVSDVKKLFEYLFREFETRDRMELMEKLGHFGKVMKDAGVFVARHRPHSGSLYIQRLDCWSPSFVVCSGLGCHEEATIPDFHNTVCSKKCMWPAKHNPSEKGFTEVCAGIISKMRDEMISLARAEQRKKNAPTKWEGFIEVYKILYEHGERGFLFKIDDIHHGIHMFPNGQLRAIWNGTRTGLDGKYVCQYLDCLGMQYVKESYDDGSLKKSAGKNKPELKVLCQECRKSGRQELNVAELLKGVEYNRNGNLAASRE